MAVAVCVCVIGFNKTELLSHIFNPATYRACTRDRIHTYNYTHIVHLDMLSCLHAILSIPSSENEWPLKLRLSFYNEMEHECVEYLYTLYMCMFYSS